MVKQWFNYSFLLFLKWVIEDGDQVQQRSDLEFSTAGCFKEPWTHWCSAFNLSTNLFQRLRCIFIERSILVDPKTVLRFEGVALFGAATAAYFAIGAPVWLFVVLALAPDLSMLGYLAGPALGASSIIPSTPIFL